MVKNILAFFGLVFLTGVILVGVGVLGFFYDTVGLVSIPKAVLQEAVAFASTFDIADDTVLPRAVTLTVQDGSMHSAEWRNPLEMLPEASPTPLPTVTPLPTATPIPPLDPLVYRADTLVQLKGFVAALEGWLAVNDRAAADAALLDDPAWQDEMRSSLAVVVERSQALAEVGPPPAEYAGMDALFDRIQDEAENMDWFVQQGLANRDPRALSGAGESFECIKGYLTQAVNEMIAAGWSLE